jgi:hypothetical protein
MKGIVSYFEYINEYGLMQWDYINEGRRIEGGVVVCVC